MLNFKVSGLVFVGISVIAFIFYAFVIDAGDKSLHANTLPLSVPAKNSEFGSTNSTYSADHVRFGNGKQDVVTVVSVHNADVEGMSSYAALNLLNNNLDTAANGGSINVKEEKELLNYLRKNDDRNVYQLMLKKLQSVVPGSVEAERLFEYSLSFLAAVDSHKASELFYSLIVANEISGSSAIYSANKSIERLSRSPEYTQLAQDAFSGIKAGNLFLAELAKSIAVNAEDDNVEFLLSFVDGDNKEKQYASQSAMKYLKNESLVPLLKEKITQENSSNVQNASLDALANMGQYEASVALIKWSSEQPVESLEKVAALFNVAITKSPSTTRAIVKEIDYLNFVSPDIKQKIVELAQLKNQSVR